MDDRTTAAWVLIGGSIAVGWWYTRVRFGGVPATRPTAGPAPQQQPVQQAVLVAPIDLGALFGRN